MATAAATLSISPAGIDPGRGVYDASRAAALAGIPVSTLHYWARTGFYVPSVRAAKVRLWSWGDLLALRAIDYFRREKGEDQPTKVGVARIREALAQLEHHGYSRDQLAELIEVSPGGQLFLVLGDTTLRADHTGQQVLPHLLPLVKPYQTGPHLLEPRPLLRILPGKLHGEPHVLGTRIPSATLYALHQGGYRREQILQFYPDASPASVQQAIDLEESLLPHAA